MVAPLIAGAIKTAASGAAAATRSKGGKMMHSRSATTRSKGSKMLRTNDKDISNAMDKIIGRLDKSKKALDTTTMFIRKISSSVAKILTTLAKASPAMKQQLIIFGRGIQLILRPIGDIMAKFLRPMSIWVMKVAMVWYNKFGTGKPNAMEDPVDLVNTLQKQLDIANATGADPQQISMIENDLAEAQSKVTASDKSDGGGFFKNLGGDMWESLQVSWAAIVEIAKNFWDILVELKPLWEVIGGIIGLVILGALKMLEVVLWAVALVLKGVLTVIQLYIVWHKILTNTLMRFVIWVKNSFITVWEALWQKVNDFADWISNTFISVWNRLESAFGSIVDKVTGWISKIKNAAGDVKDKLVGDVKNFFKKDEDKDDSGSATGGSITETGRYNLHAGERVVTAADVSRMGKGGGTTNNTFNISATISSDIDIMYLAEKLAALQETELRRRVSYI